MATNEADLSVRNAPRHAAATLDPTTTRTGVPLRRACEQPLPGSMSQGADNVSRRRCALEPRPDTDHKPGLFRVLAIGFEEVCRAPEALGPLQTDVGRELLAELIP